MPIEGGNSRTTGTRRGRWSQQEQSRLMELWGLRDEHAIARELNRPASSVRKMANKLFPPHRKVGPWTAKELEELKRYLGATSAEQIARILGRPLQEVEERIESLDRMREDRPWSREEIGSFKRIYGTRPDEDLARIFGRPIEQVATLAEELALSKDKAFLRRSSGEPATSMPRWRADELEILKNEYATSANLELARRLKRSVKSVVSKAHHLGLRKSADRLREMGRQNVSMRYSENPENPESPGPSDSEE